MRPVALDSVNNTDNLEAGIDADTTDTDATDTNTDAEDDAENDRATSCSTTSTLI